MDKARILRDTPSTQPLRLPLHIALFISPIFLLAPLNLHNRFWERKTLVQVYDNWSSLSPTTESFILQTFMAFGNQKPELLVKYEKLLWRTIYQIATRELNVVNAVKSFFTAIDWEELGRISTPDSSWFQTTLGKSLTLV